MKRLSELLRQEFKQYNFTVKKTNPDFSAMGTDQAYEQNNKLAKVDERAVGIMDNESTLWEWSICNWHGSWIYRYLFL